MRVCVCVFVLFCFGLVVLCCPLTRPRGAFFFQVFTKGLNEGKVSVVTSPVISGDYKTHVCLFVHHRDRCWHPSHSQEPASCRSSPVTGQQPLATRSLAVRFLAAHKPLASLSLSLCSLSLSAQAPPLPLRSHASCDRCCHPSNSQPSSPFVSSSRSLHRSLFARQPPAVRCFVRQPLASYTPTACLPSRSPAVCSPAACQLLRSCLPAACRAACQPLASCSQIARQPHTSRLQPLPYPSLCISLTVSLALCLSVQATKAGAGSALALYVQ